MKIAVRIIFTLTLLQLALKSFSQRQVTGRVVDELTKKPIKEAKIVVQGKEISTQTNYLGFFQLTVDSLDLLTVSNTDYEPLTFPVPNTDKFQIPLRRAQISIYRGGMESFYKFIGRNIKYPYDARTSGKQGYVYISFQIDSLGKLNNLDLISDIGGGCGEEVFRIMNAIPSDYIPDASNSVYILPIRFRLGDSDNSETAPVVELPIGKKLTEFIVTARTVGRP